MPPSGDIPADTSLWIGPHRFETELPLPQECADALRDLRRRALRRVLIAWAVVPALFAAFLAVCVLIPANNDLLLGLTIIVPLLAVIPAILISNDATSRLRAPARRALKHAHLHRYVLDPRIEEDLLAAKAIGHEITPPPRTLDLYPSIGRVARVDDQVLQGWRAADPIVQPVAVANSPQHPPSVHASSRTISQAEVHELHGFRRKLRRPRAVALLFFGALALAVPSGVAYSLYTGRIPSILSVKMLWPCLFEAFLIRLLWASLRAKRFNSRLLHAIDRDLADGSFRVLDRDALHQWLRRKAPDESTVSQSAELLLHADLLWSIDGVPTTWRVQP